MRVQVYKDGPARAFAPGDQYMVCELNANTREEVEEAMRKLRYRRRGAWEKTSWGYEAKFRAASSHPKGVSSE